MTPLKRKELPVGLERPKETPGHPPYLADASAVACAIDADLRAIIDVWLDIPVA